MKKILLLSSALIITSACSSKTKKTLGLTETMPDEYQATRNKALEIPPGYDPSNIVDQKEAKKSKDKKLSDAEKALLEEVK